MFACGDIAHGPRLFIDAIASAQIAARSMHDFLRGTRTDVVLRKQWTPAAYTMAEGWNVTGAREPAGARKRRAAPPRSRSSKSAIPKQDGRRQAARCLRCNVNTVFDTEICIACNGCVDVCPENLIRWSA